MSKRITNVKSGKSSAKKILSIIAVVLAFVIVVGSVSVFAMIDNGFVQRHTVAMSSENYEVSSAMMNYYFNTLYRNYASTLTSMGLDTSKSLKEQDYISGEQTWYDYLMSMTKSQVEQLLVLCEAAKAEGFKLEDVDVEGHDHSPEETLAAMKTVASQSGVTLNVYLEYYYGKGVNEKVFRECYEMSELASHYSEHITDQYSFTEEEWENYYKENLDTFRKVDYLTYTFQVEKAEVKKDATDEEKAAAEALDKEEAARLEILANELTATTTPEAFKAYVDNYLRTDLYADELAAQADADKAKDDKTEKIDVEAEVEACLKTGATNSATSDLNKWLFDDKRVANETYQTKGSDGLSFTVYMILPAADTTDIGYACMYRDTYNLKNIRYIPFTVADYNNSAEDAKTAAEEVFETYNDDPTEDTFANLADELGDGTYAGGLVEGADKGAFGDEGDAWLYDSARKKGDCTIVSDDKGSYMLYYIGDNDLKWQVQADSALKEAKYNEDYEALSVKYPCKTFKKGIEFVTEVEVATDTTSVG